MALDGNGFRGFASSGSSGGGVMLFGTRFNGVLDSNGQFIITLANADTYKVQASFQEDTTGESGIFRIDEFNTTQITLQADLGNLTSGKKIAGTYWL